jgi:hypothetical protein
MKLSKNEYETLINKINRQKENEIVEMNLKLEEECA